MKMTRRIMFSASKSDWIVTRSEAENREIFGENATPEPYGHNYFLDVTVEGKINPITGIILNIKQIDRLVKESVIHLLDKSNLNLTLNDTPVTSETLTLWIRDRVSEGLPIEVRLSSIRIEETPLDAIEWSNESESRSSSQKKASNTMLLTRVYEFAASHRLHSPHLSEDENQELFGKCHYPNGHGHNYILEVTVSGEVNPRDGRVVKPETLDTIVNDQVVDRYDHRHLNLDFPEFEATIPSTEILTKIIWERLNPKIPPPVQLYRVLIRETSRNIFEYYGEDSKS